MTSTLVKSFVKSPNMCSGQVVKLVNSPALSGGRPGAMPTILKPL